LFPRRSPTRPYSNQHVDLVQRVEHYAQNAATGCPRRYPQLTFQQTVRELTQHCSRPHRQPKHYYRGVAVVEDFQTMPAANAMQQCLKPEACRCTEGDRYHASPRLVGPEALSAAQRGSGIDRPREQTQPAELYTQTVEGEPDQQRREYVTHFQKFIHPCTRLLIDA